MPVLKNGIIAAKPTPYAINPRPVSYTHLDVYKRQSLFNPIVYLISGFRWCFYGVADVNVTVSFGMTVGFLVLCLVVISWIFKTGYRLKN